MANGNPAAGFAASAGPVVRAEYSCHSFPEATRHGPPRRTPPGQVRGREPQTAPGTGQPPDDDRIGEITGAGRRIWRGATAGDGVMITRWPCGQPLAFPTCSRRLTVTRVRRGWSWPGRANVQRVTPISGTLLIPACHGCVPQRYSRVNCKPRVNPVRCPGLPSFPSESGVIVLVTVLC